MYKIYILILCMLLTACNNTTNIISRADYTADKVCNIYVEKEYAPQKYEPNYCYTGAYILSNNIVNFSIKEFEKETGKKHSSYIYHMNTESDLPLKWVLECISNNAIPCFILNPENIDNPFNINLQSIAKKFAVLKVPMFVQLYPNPTSKYDKSEYISFFKKAKKVFNEYASNVALIWCVSSDDIFTSSSFYPGDEFVDWVGLNIYETIDKEGNIKNINNEIDYFCYMYQESKPIMISQLGISHYTSQNHKYYTQQTIEEINKIYSVIIPNQPRIKAVYYMDFNNINLSPSNTICDNFSITDNEKILLAYKEAIKNNCYSVDKNSNQDTELLKLPFLSYVLNDVIYVSKDFYSYLFDKDDFYDEIIINNTICIKAEKILKQKGYNIREENKKIIIRKI